MKKIMLFVCCLLLFTSVNLCKADPYTDLTQNDIPVLTQWFSDQESLGLPFVSGGGQTMPASVCGTLFGVIPGFEVGANLSIFGWQTKKISDLKVIDNDYVNKNLVALGMITPVIHAKLGLPLGFDLGVKYGKISNIPIPALPSGMDVKFDTTLMGFEVRKRILGGGVAGLLLPDLCLSAGYSLYSGSVTVSYPFTTNYSGMDVKFDNATFGVNWKDMSCISLGAMLSKNLIFITPFLGVQYNIYGGKVTTDISANGTLTVSPLPVQSFNVPVSKTSDAASQSELRLLGGAELDIFFLKIHLGGEYSMAGKYAANAGLRLQF